MAVVKGRGLGWIRCVRMVVGTYELSYGRWMDGWIGR